MKRDKEGQIEVGFKSNMHTEHLSSNLTRRPFLQFRSSFNFSTWLDNRKILSKQIRIKIF